jgi:hypothetical protein
MYTNLTLTISYTGKNNSSVVSIIIIITLEIMYCSAIDLLSGELHELYNNLWMPNPKITFILLSITSRSS